MAITWTSDLDTGIPVIDTQHMRIVEYINTLERAIGRKDASLVKQVLNDCIDYTVSHFAFEESLQEEAGYAYCKPHKKVHELFTRRVGEYKTRIEAGDDVSAELHDVLTRWLLNHIRRDDADYVSAVKAKMIGVIEEKEKQSPGGWFRRFFKRT